MGMTPDRLSVGQVSNMVKEYWESRMQDDEDLEGFEETRITQALIDEMNAEMKLEGIEVNIAQMIWEVLVDDDDDYFQEAWADGFESWVEENCA